MKDVALGNDPGHLLVLDRDRASDATVRHHLSGAPERARRVDGQQMAHGDVSEQLHEAVILAYLRGPGKCPDLGSVGQ